MARRSQHDRPGPSGGLHPDTDTPLCAFRRIVVVCHDCGDATVLDEADLRDLSAVPTFGALWRHAFCRSCRAQGATGPANVELRGETHRTERPSEPQWSSKPVFGDERRDLNPQLPRRPLFGR